MKFYLALCILLMAVSLNIPAQETSSDTLHLDFSVENSFKYSKIVLKSGTVKRPKNIIINENEVLYNGRTPEGEPIQKSYDFNEIESMKVASGSHFLAFTAIGAGVGIITYIITRSMIQSPRTSIFDPRGYDRWYASEVNMISITTPITYNSYGVPVRGWSTYEYSYIMSSTPTILILGGSITLGAVTGYIFKKGWKTVVPQHAQVMNNFSFNVSMNRDYHQIPMMNISYRF